MISQDFNRNIYVANSNGLLEYSGSRWNLYPMPNSSIVRSLQIVGERIYTGAYMEVGFWTRTKTGILEYTSLLPKFPVEIRDGEQFWHMEHIGNILVIQSFEGLYLYNINRDEITRVNTPAGSFITNLFKGENTVYFQVISEGLFAVQNSLPQLLIPPAFLPDIELMHVYKLGKELHLVSRRGNFYIWNGEELVQTKTGLSEKLKNRTILKALSLEDNSLVLGTVEDGIYYVNEQGEILLHFNQENGLGNNTVLNLFKDKEENIWAGLDNGLSIINLDSPYQLYRDIYGNLGAVYASYRTEEYLYLGTNQGLFYKKDGENRFHFIEGTNGQVWNLQFLDGTLFCGHNNGTYVIENDKATRIFDYSGTWVVKKYRNHPGFYLQGHYNGISLLEKIGGEFFIVGVVENFMHSSKFILSEANGDIWVGNEHKGVFKFRLKESKIEIAAIENYTFPDITGITSSIFKFNDSIYYSAKEQLFQYRPSTNSFSEEHSLGKIFKETSLESGKIINIDDKIWGFSKNSIFNVEVSPLSASYKFNEIYLTEDLRNITLGYENITHFGDENYLLGVANGYFKFKNTSRDETGYAIKMDRIQNSALDEEPQLLGLSASHELYYKNNNISFNFSIPEYKKFLSPVYSYRLLGFSSNWGPWTGQSEANFKNLAFGDYEFQVRGQMGEHQIEPLHYKFEIARPWYYSYLAISIYLILFAGMIYLVNKAYKRKHLKLIKENEKELRMKNLEAEKKIVELQNDQLERDMANKNKELAISTMSLIKKNEFLTSIKEKLKTANEFSKVRSVIKTIDKDIDEEDNWNIFKDAFNNADKDFFKKIKSKHPNLTANDLKLCAYLRLNLSSKEIAPLLNISVKSVEIKRYRLRKKMELTHDSNLVNYILEV